MCQNEVNTSRLEMKPIEFKAIRDFVFNDAPFYLIQRCIFLFINRIRMKQSY